MTLNKKKPSWQKWENEVASILGGDVVPRSGAGMMHKGDVKSHSLLIDCKHTDTAKYTLTVDMLDKIYTWAMNESCTPVMAIETNNCRLIIIPQLFYYDGLGGTSVPLVDYKVTPRSKSITAAYNKDVPTIIKVGTYDLMVYSFDRFVEEFLNENQEN